MNHQTEPQAKKPFYKKWWVWLIAVVVVGGIASSGGDDKKVATTASEETSRTNTPTTAVSQSEAIKGYKIGDAVKFDESEWTVTSAKNLGQSLSHEMMGNKTTEGKFILITYKVTNKTNKEEHILETPKLIDSQGREFKEYDEQLFYLPENSKSIIMAALPSGMPKNFGAIYEVPADAKGLKFQTRDMSAFGADKELVEIGI